MYVVALVIAVGVGIGQRPGKRVGALLNHVGQRVALVIEQRVALLVHLRRGDGLGGFGGHGALRFDEVGARGGLPARNRGQRGDVCRIEVERGDEFGVGSAGFAPNRVGDGVAAFVRDSHAQIVAGQDAFQRGTAGVVVVRPVGGDGERRACALVLPLDRGLARDGCGRLRSCARAGDGHAPQRADVVAGGKRKGFAVRALRGVSQHPKRFRWLVVAQLRFFDGYRKRHRAVDRRFQGGVLALPVGSDERHPQRAVDHRRRGDSPLRGSALLVHGVNGHLFDLFDAAYGRCRLGKADGEPIARTNGPARFFGRGIQHKGKGERSGDLARKLPVNRHMVGAGFRYRNLCLEELQRLGTLGPIHRRAGRLCHASNLGGFSGCGGRPALGSQSRCGSGA